MSSTDFDRLKIYFREPFVIDKENCHLTINQPSVGDIVQIGEKIFYSSIYSFVGNTTMYRLQLWEMGIDWNKYTDYDLFSVLIKTVDPEVSKLIFGDVDFTKFNQYSIRLKDAEEDEAKPTLINLDQEIEINEETYLYLRDYLRIMFGVNPKVEYATNRVTAEAIIEEEKSNLEFEKMNKEIPDSTLFPLISACLNHPGFKYKLDEIRDMGIFQFMDSVQRLEIYESSRALNAGAYSGFADMSKVDKNLFNFMRDVNYKG